MREKIIAQEKEQSVLATLHQILTPFLLRRLKMDVEFSLPPKKEVLVYAPLTDVQVGGGGEGCFGYVSRIYGLCACVRLCVCVCVCVCVQCRLYPRIYKRHDDKH